MADPKPYTRGYSFTNYQADVPDQPLPGNRLDVELDNIAEASSELTARVNAGIDVSINNEALEAVGAEIGKVVFVADNMDTVREVADLGPNLELAVDLFLGAFANDPATTGDGDPLKVGATYYNTLIGESRVWAGPASGWIPVAKVSTGGVLQGGVTASGGQKEYLVGDYVSIMLARNGLVLEPGTDFTMTSPTVTVPAVQDGDRLAWFAILKGTPTDAASFVRRAVLTTAGRKTYALSADGSPLNLTQTNHVLFGGSPFGMLTYGVDYTVADGALVLDFSPSDGELFHIFSMPRFTNSEAQVILQDFREEVADDLAQATESARALRRDVGETPRSMGAEGNGITNDTAVLRGYAAEPGQKPVFSVAGDVNPSAGARLDFRRATLRKNITANATMVGGTADGVWIENVTLDMARDTLGNAPGHGISINGSRNTARNVDVLNYGSDGVGGGSSIRFGAGKLNRIEGGEHVADPTANTNLGWLYSSVNFGFVRDVHVANVQSGIAYAHELKNSSSFNFMVGLSTEKSKHALVYGQDTGTGPSHNLAMGVIAGATDRAFYTGYSDDNVLVGLLLDTTGRPGATTIRLVSLAESDRNAVHAAHISGPANAVDRLVDLHGNDNYIGASLHSEGRIRYQPGAVRNVVEVYHPGPRDSIAPSIEDTSGAVNVTLSPATGERLGSLAGRFHDRLGNSGAPMPVQFNWLYENSGPVYLAAMTPDQQPAGFAHYVPSGTVGNFFHTYSGGEWFWALRTGGADALRVYADRLVPRVPMALGETSRKFTNARVQEINPGPDGTSSIRWLAGAGSPEGAITAAVGSLYTRTDGGAGTTLYVKQSGNGATGWAAK